jgi:hypothetical protein
MTKNIAARTETAGRHKVTVSIRAQGSSNIPSDRLPTKMPASIPEDQRYFWTNDWQASEARADADIAAGRTQEFDNFLDLAKELLSPE